MREAPVLLEREEHFEVLERRFREAREGNGRLVLVTGAAGTGKTALVKHFTDGLTDCRVLWGMCDDLVVPRPLGPFRDMASAAPALGAAIASGDHGAVLDAVMEEIGRPPRPSVLVVEDAHWADQTTLDVIAFVGRRIDRLPALLVVTHRDPGIPSDHLLRKTIGSVPATNLVRLEVGPLSPEAVAELAGPEDAAQIFRLTGGNPFFVTELLRTGDLMPATVQDAVVARLGELTAIGRECVELASIVPHGVEDWLLEGCGVGKGLAEAIDAGHLLVDDGKYHFSHELARRAVEDQLARDRFIDFHHRVLNVLAARDAEPARLAHHAFQAGDASAVARFAPLAARQAIELHSHREALEHLRQALSVRSAFSAREQAELLEEYAQECLLASHLEDAASALEEAISLRGDEDRERVGSDLVLLSEVRWAQARGPESEKAARQAVELLQDMTDSPALAAAYAALAKLAMVDVRNDDVVAWGERAVEIARRIGDSKTLAHALNSLGSARLRVDPADDSLLVESLRVGIENDLHDETIARAYLNLAACHLENMQYEPASRYIEEGLEYCDRHDVHIYTRFLLSIRSWLHMELGRWPAAEADVADLVGEESVVAIRALRVLGHIQARRGDPAALQTLERARDLADRLGESQGLIPITAALAEWHWLQGTLEHHVDDLEEMYRRALATRVPRWIGETGVWLARAGVEIQPPEGTSLPYLYEVRGQWREAAAAWEALGRPYEQASALAECDDPDAVLAALAILDRLDAAPRAAQARRKLTDMGVTRIPRGPNRHTRRNPAGLTRRQTEVLRLLAHGLTYRQIADRMYISAKTVDHHVTAIRAKLGVSSREEAVTEASRMGLIDP